MEVQQGRALCVEVFSIPGKGPARTGTPEASIRRRQKEERVRPSAVPLESPHRWPPAVWACLTQSLSGNQAGTVSGLLSGQIGAPRVDLQLQVAWGREQASSSVELLAASWSNSSHTWLQSRLLPAGRVPLVKFSVVLELLVLPVLKDLAFPGVGV